MAGADTYVFNTQYDSASRTPALHQTQCGVSVTSRELGNGLVQNYDYYAWDEQGGRLENLSTESLQNFTYQYDAVGNILSIADSVNSQTQTFDYDELDRLWHAGATGTTGQGGYATETYLYDGTTGNLSSKAGVNYTYDATHEHAVASLSNGNTYTYDQNGNMITRHVGTQTFNFAYDAENRLVSVSGSATASFLYDADGQRIKSTMDGATTIFVGSHYEKVGTSITKYYMAGASRVAMRKDGTVSYLLSDHLSSSSISTDASGNRTSELRYKAWGETRYSFGTMPTKYQFTGQYAYTDDPSTPQSEGFGLVYFNASWMDPSLGRFTQPDTIVPTSTQGTQAWDRYAFVNNNPVRYNDPTGHDLIPWNTFTFSLPAITFGAKIGSFGPSLNGSLTWAVDLRPTKNFVSYLQNNPDYSQLFNQTAQWITGQNGGLLVGGSVPAGIEAKASVVVKPGVTTQTMEELAGWGGDVTGEVNGSAALCLDSICGGLEGSLDQSGNLQSESLIVGAGAGGHLTTDVVSYQEWAFWTDLDYNSCSNVPGVDGTGECPGQ